LSAILVKGGLILTLDPERPMVQGDLLVDNGRIEAMGTVLSQSGAEVVSAEGSIVMPGFVQLHVHLTQALFRGLANDVQLLDWLYERILPLESAHDAESLYDSARLGLAEMIRSGTTTVVDVGAARDVDSVFEAIEESGIRAQSGHLLMDSPGTYDPLRQPTDEAVQQAVDTFERWDGRADGRIRGSFIPRGLLSVTPELLREIAPLAEERQAFIHTHAHENLDEIEQIAGRWGERPIPAMATAGIVGPRLQLAHCVWLAQDDMEILKAHDVKVVHCPSANAKLASGIAPIPEILAEGITVALGADGAPCNDNLDPFVEMRLAGLLQKLRLGPKGLLAPQIVEMATGGGARALGLGGEIGSLEIGKQADLIVVDGSGLHVNPWEPGSLLDLLVYAFRGGDVRTTIVGGRILMKDRELVSMSQPEVLERARRSRERVLSQLGWL
jgi:cytosine/adenosine deaminase-related metal-dependent hydrolase